MILGDGQCDVRLAPGLKSGTRPTRTFPRGFDFHAFALCHAGVVVSSIVLPAHRQQHFVTHALWTVVRVCGTISGMVVRQLPRQ